VRARIELLLAVVAAVGCVLSWLAASSTVVVAPVLEGEPPTTSVTYSPPLLVLSLLLATVAGVLVVIGVSRLRRGQSRRNGIPGRLTRRFVTHRLPR
jgi:hypothetical protein